MSTITEALEALSRLEAEAKKAGPALSPYHIATIRAALVECERLQAKLERVEKIRDAAMRYIDLSPCDPDITHDQEAAWNELREALSGPEGAT